MKIYPLLFALLLFGACSKKYPPCKESVMSKEVALCLPNEMTELQSCQTELIPTRIGSNKIILKVFSPNCDGLFDRMAKIGIDEYYTLARKFLVAYVFRSQTGRKMTKNDLKNIIKRLKIEAEFNWDIVGKQSFKEQFARLGEKSTVVDKYVLHRKVRAFVAVEKIKKEGEKLVQVVITNVVLAKGRLVYIKYHHPYFDKNSVSKAKQENNRMVWRFFEANTLPEEIKK